MGSLFSVDGGVFSFLNKAANLVILNLLCLLCCIPVVTAGASITAMFYVTLKMVKDEDSYIVRSFFRSFKENFKQATVIWVLFLLFVGILYADLRIVAAYTGSETFTRIMQIAFLAIGLFILLTYMYVFPVLSKFVNSTRRTVLNALLMSIRHFPWTVLMIIVTALPIAILYFFTNYGIPIVLLIGFSLTAYINSFMFRRIFENYIPAATEPESTWEQPAAEAFSGGAATAPEEPTEP